MASYLNPWMFNGEPFESSSIGDSAGFVYCITHRDTGKKYIGRKYFWSKSKESDWKSYYGSSKELQDDIEKFGKEAFERTILSIHKTRGSVNYCEIEEQILRRVIHDESYYNRAINGKYFNVDLDNVEYDKRAHTEKWKEIHSKFMKAYMKETIWINNGKRNRRHPKDYPIPSGWVSGQHFSEERKKSVSKKIKRAWKEGKFDARPKPAPLSEETKSKIRDANLGPKNPRYGKPNSAYQKKKLRDSVVGTVWINKDGKNKRVKKESLESFLSNGWNVGNLQVHSR